ncbi:hypothetical protein F383_17620 [Gossypium arboreum]|uniref:Uncharacterized protein n=1 Tax=Gossypium arboreum TaxID=29729 RepID=A0A0B0NP81_GOSAR|nr:hypothetical protein F383_17620 [Gossypium arboreum]
MRQFSSMDGKLIIVCLDLISGIVLGSSRGLEIT